MTNVHEVDVISVGGGLKGLVVAGKTSTETGTLRESECRRSGSSENAICRGSF